MKVTQIIKYHLKPFLNHPINEGNSIKAILRFIKWQLKLRLIKNHELIVPFIGGSKFIVKKGRTGLTGNLYSGLHEFYDMAFLLHYLRPKDTFFDIGSNVGSYSILSAAHIGSTTYSFEPVPDTFQKLQFNRAINQNQTIWHLNQVAIGDAFEDLLFSIDNDTENSIVTDNYQGETLRIKSVTLDYFCNYNNVIPDYIKIDAEGYDENVIIGFQNTLQDKKVNVIAIEGDSKLVFQILMDLGFNQYSYNPFTRKFSKGEKNGSNQLYIRNIEDVENRVKNAIPFEVFGKKI